MWCASLLRGLKQEHLAVQRGSQLMRDGSDHHFPHLVDLMLHRLVVADEGEALLSEEKPILESNFQGEFLLSKVDDGHLDSEAQLPYLSFVSQVHENFLKDHLEEVRNVIEG